MTLGGGDSLARGARSAQFGSTKNVTDNEWTAIFGEGSIRPNVMSDEESAIVEAAMAAAQAEIEKQEPKKEAKFRAIQDRIVVRRVEAETKVGNIVLADESKEKPYHGIVIGVGPGKHINGQFVPTTVNKGERVVFGRFSGAEVKIGVEDYLVLREEDLFVVLEEN